MDGFKSKAGLLLNGEQVKKKRDNKPLWRDANFQCHWICLRVKGDGGWGCGRGAGGVVVVVGVVGCEGGGEITVNVTPAPLSIIHFQSIAVGQPAKTAWR